MLAVTAAGLLSCIQRIRYAIHASNPAGRFGFVDPYDPSMPHEHTLSCSERPSRQAALRWWASVFSCFKANEQKSVCSFVHYRSVHHTVGFACQHRKQSVHRCMKAVWELVLAGRFVPMQVTVLNLQFPRLSATCIVRAAGFDCAVRIVSG